jgi:hypothetical protein
MYRGGYGRRPSECGDVMNGVSAEIYRLSAPGQRLSRVVMKKMNAEGHSQGRDAFECVIGGVNCSVSFYSSYCTAHSYSGRVPTEVFVQMRIVTPKQTFTYQSKILHANYSHASDEFMTVLRNGLSVATTERAQSVPLNEEPWSDFLGQVADQVEARVEASIAAAAAAKEAELNGPAELLRKQLSGI